MKAYGGIDVYIHIFLTSALVGEWLASHPGCFTPGENAFGTHCIGGWVGPRAGLDVEKREFFTLPGLELLPVGRPAHTNYAIPGPGMIRSIEKSNSLIGNQTRDLPACSLVYNSPTACPLS
jgi:hypothetical protein